LFLIHARYGWFKSQKEDVRTKVVADSLTTADTALTDLKNSFTASLPGGPDDARSQAEIDHAQRHLTSARDTGATTESQTAQKDRVLRSLDGLDI
jgi:hypothetical protein